MASDQTILSATELHFHIGDHHVLKNATLAVERGERIGIIGRNGCGKSTFLRILNGSETPHQGGVRFRREAIVGVLTQEFTLTPGATVRESVAEGAKAVRDLLDRYEQDPTDEIETAITRLDGWSLDNRVEMLMSTLQTPPPDHPVDNLSGGEKRRVSLCRALAANPDLLLLDEPTNHLDMESIAWLGHYLAKYPGALLLVSHDRHFLDTVITRMVELRGGQFDSYPGNYSKYLIRKAEKVAGEEKAESKRQSFLRREIDWVRRGPPARTTKSQARLDRYYAAKNADGPLRDENIDLLVPEPPRLGNQVINATNLSMTLGGKLLFSKLDLELKAGMRIGLVGRNGTGKTTLLKCLTGQRKPDTGTVKIAETVHVNMMDQERLRLDESKTIMEEISRGAEKMNFGDQTIGTRSYLKRFLFTDERLRSRISHLSGGEKSRLLLAKMFKDGGNVLVLDEPTNDLDLSTLRVLEQSLEDFPGLLLVVSHDRAFLNHVTTHTLAFTGNGNVILAEGNVDYFFEKHPAAAPSASPKNAATKSTAKPVAKAAPTAQTGTTPARKLSYKEGKELANMEDTILAAESAIEDMEAKFADPDWCQANPDKLADLGKDVTQARADCDALYARWEELAAIKEAAQRK